MRQLYAGIDLHSNNNYIGILDKEDTRIYHKRLPNQRDVILAELEPFKQDMASISSQIGTSSLLHYERRGRV